MELRQLRYVLMVAEERNFSRAAKKLHIAQPSLSQQIAKLEKEMGVNLFSRDTNQVKLTSAGERFVESAGNILDMVEQLEKEMSDVANLRQGKLVVGSLSMTGTHLLPMAIPAFKQRYPGIEVVLMEDSTANLEKMTAKGQVDICLLSLPLFEPSLDYQPVLQEEIMLAVPPDHPWKGHSHVAVSQLKDEPFIFIKKGQGFHHISLELCRRAGFEPNIVFESANIETIQSLVSAGMGIAFVPKMVTKNRISSFTPVYLPITDPVPSRTLVFAYRQGRYLSKAALAFIETVKEAAG